MRRLVIPLVGAIALLALPGSALAQSDGSTCTYTASQDVTTFGVTGPTAAVYADASGNNAGSSGTATAAAGACLNTNTPANDVEGGTGEVGAGTSTGGLPGAYGVIDGDNDNVDPVVGTSPANSQSDGYIGLSNYENGANQDPVGKALECVASGPDNAGNSGTNSGGCIGPDGGPVWVPIPVVPSPICGNTSGNTWHSTSRDGCSAP